MFGTTCGGEAGGRAAWATGAAGAAGGGGGVGCAIYSGMTKYGTTGSNAG